MKFRGKSPRPTKPTAPPSAELLSFRGELDALEPTQKEVRWQEWVTAHAYPEIDRRLWAQVAGMPAGGRTQVKPLEKKEFEMHAWISDLPDQPGVRVRTRDTRLYPEIQKRYGEGDGYGVSQTEQWFDTRSSQPAGYIILICTTQVEGSS